MKPVSRPATDNPGRDDAVDVAVPPIEAVLAGTLALMTGVAEHPLKGMRPLEVRRLMAGKVVGNLLTLGSHPQLSGPLRSLLLQLSDHWQRIADPASPAQSEDALRTLPPCTLWHRNPGSVQ